MEWTVVTVIITMVGLGVSVIKPLLALNSTIVRLEETVSALKTKLDSYTLQHEQSHIHIISSINRQEQQLLTHELRFQGMDGKATGSTGITQ